MPASRPDWLLIDGSSLIFRAFYASRNSADLHDAKAVRAFLESLARLVLWRRPVRVAIAADEDWRPLWRVDLIPTYKSHRVAEPIPPDLIPQMPQIQAVLEAIGVEYVGAPELEAEDVIASWVEQLPGQRIEIVSGDRDLFALVHDPEVKVLYPEKGGMAEVDEAEITRRYGIPGRRYGDFAILRGDPSDGLPGLNGVGEQTASRLIRRHGGIEELIASGTLSDEDIAYVRLAQQVVRPGSSKPVALPEGRNVEWRLDAGSLDVLISKLQIKEAVGRLVDALHVSLTQASIKDHNG
ncbi:MAG TPA: 5'-3' exonuclease H3TH domain-containing protein [Chloroflexota bacterium]|nr:5'-3' exonuclease H3TH domain-containing protein [Chloroflexota bacterium]